MKTTSQKTEPVLPFGLDEEIALTTARVTPFRYETILELIRKYKSVDLVLAGLQAQAHTYQDVFEAIEIILEKQKSRPNGRTADLITGEYTLSATRKLNPPAMGSGDEPDPGAITQKTMRDATALLPEGVNAVFDFPGCIYLTRDGVDYAIGDVNGDYTYNRVDGEPLESILPDLNQDAKAEELAEWIVQIWNSLPGSSPSVHKPLPSSGKANFPLPS